MRFCLATAVLVALTSAAGADLPEVIVDRPGLIVDDSCRLRFPDHPQPDVFGTGVVRIESAPGRTAPLVVELVSPLRGADPNAAPDTYAGIGIAITGPNVVLRGANLPNAVSGFKTAVQADEADGLRIEGLRLDDNFRRRLGSTATAEDAGDWLRPHDNDLGEWCERYGAGLAVRRSRDVDVSGVRVRNGQNGIILDRVTDARIYDNDCSFLSGWGLALWRSSRNLICRNAFDFCVRGYEHGVYNRGQDSAGLLLFEQCHENVIALNSITHGGDGIFAFAGREALGETPLTADAEDADAGYVRRGHRNNAFIGNDLSYAAAHGLELTFSFNNQIRDNRIVGNAICGVWGGYSQGTVIAGNTFEDNGAAGYGLERGGVNVEHGADNVITANIFRRNACGVHLWTDDDPELRATPWFKANGRAGTGNMIVANQFHDQPVGIELRETLAPVTVAANMQRRVEAPVRTEGEAPVVQAVEGPFRLGRLDLPELVGTQAPIGARSALGGREAIVMTPWGPWDHEGILLRRETSTGSTHTWRLLGATPAASISVAGLVDWERTGDEIVVRSARAGTATPYVISAGEGVHTHAADGVVIDATWDILCFPWTQDPRDDVRLWYAEARTGQPVQRARLDLAYASGGPADLEPEAWSTIPSDRFGTIARTTVTLPAGLWTVTTRSDDGIRVWVDDRKLIDDWTWHPPKRHSVEFAVAETGPISVRVEHFELDGFAVLRCDLTYRGPLPADFVAPTRVREPASGHGPPQPTSRPTSRPGG